MNESTGNLDLHCTRVQMLIGAMVECREGIAESAGGDDRPKLTNVNPEPESGFVHEVGVSKLDPAINRINNAIREMYSALQSLQHLKEVEDAEQKC